MVLIVWVDAVNMVMMVTMVVLMTANLCTGLLSSVAFVNRHKSACGLIRIKHTIWMSQSDAEIPLLSPYEGPLGTLDSMETGFSLEELGLELMVGKSKVGEGRGLFISVAEDVEEAILPQGTVLCGYSKGTFAKEAADDKTVGFLLGDLNTVVIFNKQLLPLVEVIEANGPQVQNLTTIVQGHLLFKNESEPYNKIKLMPDPNHGGNYYFIPSTSEGIGITNIGMYANDLAYNSAVNNEKEYRESSDSKNILMLVWRLELDNQMLRPTWPVVMLKQDVFLTNHEPMEIGIQYSWNYWEAAREGKK